jgi:DNA-binding beta-propeller fold protein YncE
VSAYDAATRAVTATIPVGSILEGIAVSPDGGNNTFAAKIAITAPTH